MKKRLAAGSIAVASLLATTGALTIAPAVAHAETMAMSHTWSGKVVKVNAMMGTTDSFQFVVGTSHYVVDYTSKVKFTMGMSSGIVAGAKITVTGTLKGTTITASKLSL